MTNNDAMKQHELNELSQKEIIPEGIEDDEDHTIPLYDITSYGADFDVFGLVRRLEQKEILKPPFQRAAIWSPKDCSRFIESLLIGLPVPGIFLSVDQNKNFLIIDGQQRLLSLKYFYKGTFGDSNRKFALQGVQERFLHKTYQTLDAEDRRQLDNTIIHATIIKQIKPAEDHSSSLYYIFQRINQFGTPLTSQEIRAAIFHGLLNNLLEKLNETEAWRAIYGPSNKRRRDQELILRFFALYFQASDYNPPMKEFLNKYMIKNRNLKVQSGDELSQIFRETTEIIYLCIGERAFRIANAINVAIFDAVMVGVARRLEKGNIENQDALSEAYDALLRSSSFLEAIETGTTASEASVKARIGAATKAFQSVE